MATVSAFWPVMVAVDTALTGDTILAPLLNGDKVFSGSVPVDTELDYITLIAPSEAGFRLFGTRSGSEGTLQIDVWARTFLRAAAISGEVARVLDGALLTLGEGHYQIRGMTELLMILAEPNDDEIQHGIIRYQWTTVR